MAAPLNFNSSNNQNIFQYNGQITQEMALINEMIDPSNGWNVQDLQAATELAKHHSYKGERLNIFCKIINAHLKNNSMIDCHEAYLLYLHLKEVEGVQAGHILTAIVEKCIDVNTEGSLELAGRLRAENSAQFINYSYF